MRCKKHLTDLSSRVGVCASCLRERLCALIAAQARAEAQEDRRKYDAQNPPPPHVAFPRSVSPYVSGNLTNQSDYHHHLHRSLKDQLFFSTPQIGPNCGVFPGDLNAKQQKKSKFSLFSRLFKFKSRNPEPDLDPRVSDSNSNSRSSCTAASSSPSWFSNMLPGHRKKQSRMCSLNEPTARFARGMSPARVSDYGGEAEWYESESSQSWWHTPERAAQPSRRGGRRSHSRNLSGMKFCLSPLVRASPNRHWNQKGVLPDAVFSGEIRVPARTHMSPAASLCVSRSRKLADFGRIHHNH